MGNNKYYWLKLKRDFFKRHDISIIEAMPNGKDYILFYLKLLCESVDHNGNLRFNEQIPYNEEMLSTITNTNIDVVRNAIKIFSQLNMLEVMDDGTYFMCEVNKMLGSSSQDEHTRESTRLRVQAYRERQKQAQLECKTNEENDEKRYSNVTCNGDIDIEKDIELDINKKKRANFVKPSVEEVAEYIKEKGYHIDAEEFWNFYESKNWYVGKNKMSKWKSALVTWEKNYKNKNPLKQTFNDDDKYNVI